MRERVIIWLCLLTVIAVLAGGIALGLALMWPDASQP